MSTGSSEDAEGDLRDRIETFLGRNFPQIQMHGGSAAIRDLDPEEGEVTVRLGGACSGCGISPMTVQAIKTRMTDEIPEIDTVHADTGMPAGGGPSRGSVHTDTGPSQPTPSDDKEDSPEAPF